MITHWVKTNSESASIGLAEIIPKDDEQLAEAIPTLEGLHPKKKMEFFASRQLIQNICEEMNIPYNGIRKDEFGKPFLIDSSYHISISHSYPLVACAIHPSAPCGIDIESARPQLLKIRHKFLNKEELEYCGEDISKLCLHWSTKEALYKIYGRKRLHFAEQMAVRSIDDNQIRAQIILEGKIKNYILNYEYFIDYLIVFSV